MLNGATASSASPAAVLVAAAPAVPMAAIARLAAAAVGATGGAAAFSSAAGGSGKESPSRRSLFGAKSFSCCTFGSAAAAEGSRVESSTDEQCSSVVSSPPLPRLTRRGAVEGSASVTSSDAVDASEREALPDFEEKGPKPKDDELAARVRGDMRLGARGSTEARPQDGDDATEDNLFLSEFLTASPP